MVARVLHVSDLHLGRHDVPEPIAALRELAALLEPRVLLATGDLTHRATRSQLERARELLHGLGAPVLAVPGNHDIPWTPGRFTRPFAEWTRAFGTTEPLYETDGLVVVGLNSVRPWRQQGGALSRDALARATASLRRAPDGAFRIVALHHHLAAPPWRAAHKRPLRRRSAVLGSLAQAGADLVVGGHVHQASVAELREFDATAGARARPLVLATAPGLGRPRPRRPGEALGVNAYELEAGALTVVTLAWDGQAFAEVGRRSFQPG